MTSDNRVYIHCFFSERLFFCLCSVRLHTYYEHPISFPE